MLSTLNDYNTLMEYENEYNLKLNTTNYTSEERNLEEVENVLIYYYTIHNDTNYSCDQLIAKKNIIKKIEINHKL